MIKDLRDNEFMINKIENQNTFLKTFHEIIIKLIEIMK